ncbi:MAG: response regulator [Verrucomicrobiota bacterium]
MKKIIQIIDDNVALTTLLAKTLAKFGYEPVVENNPLLAINSARHHLPDLILLDVMMPERDGGRVLADLRADFSLRYVPVVLLTAIAREAQALADTGGITSVVLSKPVQLKELVNTIESQLAASDSGASQTDQDHQSSPVPMELPDLDQNGNQMIEETPIIDMPSPEGDQFSSPGPRADIGFAPDTGDSPSEVMGGNFSFPDRAEGTNPSENPW